MSFNGLQDGTTYAGCHVGNSPDFTPLEKSLNRDILQSLHFHCLLSHFVLKGGGNDEEEKKISYANPKKIVIGLKHIWESETGSPSSTQTVKDIDWALEAFEIVYRTHDAAV